jgi:hypothetical protein
LFDPALGALEIFELGDSGRFTRALAVSSGRIDDVPGCPGMVLEMDALWAELARLGPEE